MEDVFKLTGKISVENSEANKNIDDTTKKAEDAATRISKGFEKAGSFLTGIGDKITAGGKVMTATLTTGFAGLVASGVKYNAQMEQFQMNLTTLLGSSDKATKLLSDLKEMAATTPFETTDLISATETMIGFGISADDAQKYLGVLGDISMGNSEKLKGLSLAFAQVQSTGKLTGQDLLQMINQGFNPLLYISKMTGKSMATLKEEMSDGAISAEMVADAFAYATQEGQPFYNAMENGAKTINGRISTLKDNFQMLVGSLVESLLPTFEKIVNKAIELTEKFNGLSQEQKDQIFGHMWEKFGIQSHAAYGDYDESCLFAYAVGQVAESLYKHLDMPTTVMHCNEWQTAFTILYLREHCPAIGTLFTTHATSIGRSIAGNYKPLYDCFDAFQGDQMAQELNMVSKHSAEKKAAHLCDCFTTVSDLTARECKQLLDKPVDIVTPNGFEQGFVPQDKEFDAARKRARNTLISLARAKGIDAKGTDMLIGTAGRYEWKNKGIDVFLEAMTRLGEAHASTPYILHPTPSTGAADLQPAGRSTAQRSIIAFVMIPYLDRQDFSVGNVHVIFVPTYLNGNDGVLNLPYYDLLIGLDLTVFPSYYEPWGYTPLESMAFHVPTITTSLSGYGVWCEEQGCTTIDKGVAVIYRNDSNTDDVINHIVNTIEYYLSLTPRKVAAARKAAVELALKAEWQHFFPYYREAYAIALKKASARQ